MDSLSEFAERVLHVLHQVGGVGTSTELQTRLGLSQPTVSRALSALVKKGRLLKVGAARSQQAANADDQPGQRNGCQF